ncbi:glucose N-acetyltransferase 1 [Ditylenchus destructor]|uniref:Glucose N-acetyltransferase 1 n=1 Tax=Ditylenchus destructor TaxID=166010 RepID=A0AAD4MLT6_9BILA|nr:glucose N-acetyltransferase 1 [Ditylenchus destructor]
MCSFLARVMSRFRYSYSHPDRNDVERGGGTLIILYATRLLTSKVVRVIGIISILLLVVIICYPHLSGDNIYALRPYEGENSLTHTVTESGILPNESTKRPRSGVLPNESSKRPESRVVANESSDALDWSRFAYVQYVTNKIYLCNSLMLFERLHSLGAKADKLMMYPSHFDVESDTEEARLIRQARDQYGVKLMPIQTMDELFLAPSSPVAMPRAYWLGFDKRFLSAQIVLIEPSKTEFDRLMRAMRVAKADDYDMDIVNNLYKDSALILPHRPYNLLTGEFRATNHAGYLGNPEEKWDPDAVLKEAKFLHFSDWPVPKKEQPKCEKDPNTGQENCRNRELWLGFYSDFKRRRQEVCTLGLAKRASTLNPGTLNPRMTPNTSKTA